jgi:hypothetical protein
MQFVTNIRLTLELGVVLSVLALFGFANPAVATSVTLNDGNSQVTVDPSSATGVNQWLVNGTSQLYQEWFWYRVGGTGPEQPVTSLGLVSAVATDTNPFTDGRKDTLTVKYGSATGVQVTITCKLRGGSAGSLTSDLGQTIKIANNTGAAVDMHFFEYADFDLNGTPGNDTVTILGTNHNTAQQEDAFSIMSETVTTPSPIRYEAAPQGVILGILNDAGPSNLSNQGGPIVGNATWAFQWDMTIAAHGSYTISKDKNLSEVVAVIPEPVTLLGVAGGFLGLAGGVLRRLRLDKSRKPGIL